MIFGSKKATMTGIGAILITILILVLNEVGVSEEITNSLAQLLTLIFSTYNIGQGIADFGKNRKPDVVVEQSGSFEGPPFSEN